MTRAGKLYDFSELLILVQPLVQTIEGLGEQVVNSFIPYGY